MNAKPTTVVRVADSDSATVSVADTLAEAVATPDGLWLCDTESV